jgi:hypothetical protein
MDTKKAIKKDCAGNTGKPAVDSQGKGNLRRVLAE